MNVVDLFSGYGGASEAFVEAGDLVRRYELDISVCDIVPHSIQIDLSRFRPEDEIKWFWKARCVEGIDLVWASPPCREFSRAYSAPQAEAERAGIEYTPTDGLALVEAAIRIIKKLEPKYWVIENVAGARKWLEPILGMPKQVIGPYCLWGNFPQIVIPGCTEFQPKCMKAGGHDRHSVQKRSVIPIEISRGLREAMIQPSLERWI